MNLLKSGYFEPMKAGVHGVVLGTVSLCALYNFAAWLSRGKRQSHLVVNTVVYTTATIWEFKHVQNHLATAAAVRRAAGRCRPVALAQALASYGLARSRLTE